MFEPNLDKQLGVQTSTIQMGFHPSLHHHRYEPTPYHALNELFQDYEISKQNQLVDFGCGKGRLHFYLHYYYNMSVIGVEMDTQLYEKALANKDNYRRKQKKKVTNLYFYCCLAEEYAIQPEDNIFYFFNPFSIQIFVKIIKNVLLSAEEHPRKIDIILYYPSEDYLFYLEDHPSFSLKQEVILQEKDPYEKFVIYEWMERREI